MLKFLPQLSSWWPYSQSQPDASGYVVVWYSQQCSEAYLIYSQVLEEHCLISVEKCL